MARVAMWPGPPIQTGLCFLDQDRLHNSCTTHQLRLLWPIAFGTKLENKICCSRYNIYFHRSACGIDVPGSDFVITGGENTPEQGRRVVRYTPQGAATLLPSLQEARWGHGCGYYYDQNNVLVSLKSFNVVLKLNCLMFKVFISH